MSNFLFLKRKCPNICLSKTRISKTEMSKKVNKCPTQFHPSVIPFLQRKNKHDELNFVRPSCSKKKRRQWADGRISFRPSIFPWEKKDGNEPTDEPMTTNLVSSVRREILKKKRQWYSSSVRLLTDRISIGSIFDDHDSSILILDSHSPNDGRTKTVTSVRRLFLAIFFFSSLFSSKIICPSNHWWKVTDECCSSIALKGERIPPTDRLTWFRPSVYDLGQK